MEEKTILGALKVLFGVESEPATRMPSVLDRDPDAEAFVDVKTQDGMMLRITEMAVGATVTTLDGETEAPALDGEYVLEDGTSIQVANSAIVEIASPEEDLIPEEDMGKKEAYAEEEVTVEETEEVAQQFATVEDFAKLQEANVMLAEAIDKLNARLETFAKAPTAEPVVTTTAFNKAKTVLETREERLKFFGSK